MIDLSGFSIFDIYGVERVPLEGQFDADSLTDRLIEEWIPYFECHKCGRWDYCKYAQPHPANPDRAIDIKCGVASDAIRNMVASSFSMLEALNDKEDLQCFLDGAYYFYKLIYDSEQYVGLNMSESFHDFMSGFAPVIFSRVGHLRNYINRLAHNWKNLPGFMSEMPILIVEGQSEKAFFDTLRKSHSAWFLDLQVEVYGGKGNRKSKRIQMLLNKYLEQGVVVFAQGDADGQHADIFRGLIDSGSIKEEHTFVFKHDFESSLPLPLVFEALTDLGLLEDTEKSDFVAEISRGNESVVTKIKASYGIELSSHKIDFANTIGEILNETHWWMDDDFMENTELGRFLRFVQKIPS